MTFDVHFQFQFPDTPKVSVEEQVAILMQFEDEKEDVLALFERFVKVLSRHNETEVTTPTLKVRTTERKLHLAMRMVEDRVPLISYEVVEEPRRKNADTRHTLEKAENA